MAPRKMSPDTILWDLDRVSIFAVLFLGVWLVFYILPVAEEDAQPAERKERPKRKKPVAHNESRSPPMECTLCERRARGAACVPCGHVFACWKCAERGFSTCAVCRRPVERVQPLVFS